MTRNQKKRLERLEKKARRGVWIDERHKGPKTVMLSWGQDYYWPEDERVYAQVFAALNVNPKLHELWKIHHGELKRDSELCTTGGHGGFWRRCPHHVAVMVRDIVSRANWHVAAAIGKKP